MKKTTLHFVFRALYMLILCAGGCKNSGPGNASKSSKDIRIAFTIPKPDPGPKLNAPLPIRNYVFFDLGSTDIPSRYILLKPEQVKSFNESALREFALMKTPGCSKQQMVAYYNIINILGKRILDHPETTVNLIGYSEKSIEEGRQMSASMKNYLVDVFHIEAERIRIADGTKPMIPAGHPGGTCELDQLREENRRVTIEISSPALMMESEYDTATVKKDGSPKEQMIGFHITGGDMKTWTIELKDKHNTIKHFGPFSSPDALISTKDILGPAGEGDYTVIMRGRTRSGKKVKRAAYGPLVLRPPVKQEEIIAYSVLFEINEAKAVSIYEKYLNEVFVPSIPNGAVVVIHAHPDFMGPEALNEKLPMARAIEVKRIIEKKLSRSGRNDVKFEVYGYSETRDTDVDNKLPEARYYYRTVLVEVIPSKFVTK